MVRVKRVLMASGRSGKTHIAAEAAQNGVYSYVLCRGIPSIGKHQAFEKGEEDFMEVCAQCLRILKRMRKQGEVEFLNPA